MLPRLTGKELPMKAITCFLCFLGLIVAASEARADATALQGKWKAVGAEVNGQRQPMPPGLVVEMDFQPGGTFVGTITAQGKPVSQTGTWKVTGDQVTVTVGGSTDLLTWKVTGKALTLVKRGKTEILHLER
jgi:uncharacterized protein (TIGR03066 family)